MCKMKKKKEKNSFIIINSAAFAKHNTWRQQYWNIDNRRDFLYLHLVSEWPREIPKQTTMSSIHVTSEKKILHFLGHYVFEKCFVCHLLMKKKSIFCSTLCSFFFETFCSQNGKSSPVPTLINETTMDGGRVGGCAGGACPWCVRAQAISWWAYESPSC